MSVKIRALYSMKGVQNNVRKRIATDIKGCAQDAYKIARVSAPTRSGALRRSIKVTHGASGFTLGSDLKYAKYVEEGRGWVFPIRAKALKWTDFRTGKKVFSAFARPSRANPFIRRSVEAAVQKWSNRLKYERWTLTDV